MVVQTATKPLMEDKNIGTELIISPEAKKPLTLKILLFILDMSFSVLVQEYVILIIVQAGIATQNQDLRQKLNIDKSAKQLYNF